MSTAGFASFAGAAPVLVGREREQGVLRDHLAAALTGRGGLVLITGEPGLGKTALASEAVRAAEGLSDGLVVVRRQFG